MNSIFKPEDFHSMIYSPEAIAGRADYILGQRLSVDGVFATPMGNIDYGETYSSLANPTHRLFYFIEEIEEEKVEKCDHVIFIPASSFAVKEYREFREQIVHCPKCGEKLR